MRAYGIITAISFLLLVSNCSNEEEYSGTVYLQTQAMVDDFGKSGFRTINGDLIIGPRGYVCNTPNFPQNCQDPTDIHSLSPLRRTTNISGKLEVFDMPELQSLEGLGNIHSIGGYLLIRNNSNLDDVTALQGIENVGGVDIYLSKKVPIIGFLPEQTFIKGGIYISYAAKVEGLNRLREASINDNVAFIGVDEINIFHDVTSFEGGNLLFGECGEININVLADVNASLEIGSQYISDLYAFQNIRSVTKGLKIFLSSQLTSLDGLEQLTTTSKLRISDNPNLSDFCAVTGLLQANSNIGFEVEKNKYNPSIQDILNGKCQE